MKKLYKKFIKKLITKNDLLENLKNAVRLL